jgi:hypothetical protein
MADTHWKRDEMTFYNSLVLSRSILDAPPPLGGCRGALMSKDLHSGSFTYLLELPKNWKSRFDADEACLEFFILDGDISLDGDEVGSGGYIHLPQCCGGGELRSKNGATAYAFYNPNIPAYAYPVTRNRTTKSWEGEWNNSVPGSHGVMHKSLRLPDPAPHAQYEGFDGGPGGYLRFQYISPGMVAEEEHVHHECFEEIILLQGDVMLINEGQMGIGSVVSHPQEWYHAPFASKSGAVIMVHTDSPMGYPWPGRDYPNSEALTNNYLDNLPWDRPVDHIAWEDHPLSKEQKQSKEYQAWRKTPQGALWGDDDVGDAVPEIPGKRGTASKYRASWKRSSK